MSTDSFDANGLLAALTAAMAGGEDAHGFTARELSKNLGKGSYAVLERVRKLADDGRLGVSKKRVIAIDGSTQWSASYYVKS